MLPFSSLALQDNCFVKTLMVILWKTTIQFRLRMRSFLFATLAILLAALSTTGARKECVPKYYEGLGVNSFVCVCNSTYCDTIEPLDDTPADRAGFFQEYVTARSQYRLEKSKFKFDTQANPSEQKAQSLLFSPCSNLIIILNKKHNSKKIVELTSVSIGLLSTRK